MEAIADAADVAKRTLYLHFPVKEAIVSAFWINNVRQKSDLLPMLLENFPNTRERLKAVFLDAAKGLVEEPELARAHFSYQFQQIGKDALPYLQNDFMQFLTAVIEQGQQDKELRSNAPAHEMAFQVMMNFTAVCLLRLSAPDSFELEERLITTVDCFIDGAKQQS